MWRALLPGAVLTLVVSLAVPACGNDDAGTPAPIVNGDGGGTGDRDGATTPNDEGGTTTDGGGSDSAVPVPTLRIMTFNIKHAEIGGLDGIADVIKAEKPDLVGLQEVDVDAVRSAKVDQPHRLGQLTGMTSLFRTAFDFTDGGSYGIALLSQRDTRRDRDHRNVHRCVRGLVGGHRLRSRLHHPAQRAHPAYRLHHARQGVAEAHRCAGAGDDRFRSPSARRRRAATTMRLPASHVRDR